jgi:hypothetical protein
LDSGCLILDSGNAKNASAVTSLCPLIPRGKNRLEQQPALFFNHARTAFCIPESGIQNPESPPTKKAHSIENVLFS